jgi:3-oxoacyl-[acyl-carrier protein] reductase
MFNTAEKEFGGADVLVNNAGLMLLSPIAETTDELFDRLIAINLKGVFTGMREATKRLRNGGRIISFSSSVVGLYQPTYAVYAATKAGVEAMTHVLSKELRAATSLSTPWPLARRRPSCSSRASRRRSSITSQN